MLEQIWDVADETYAVVLKGMSEAERDQLIELLTRLQINLGPLQPGGSS